MKKRSLLLTSLSSATLIFLTACCITEQDTADLCKELQTKSELNTPEYLRLGDISPNSDKYGINIEFEVVSDKLTAQKVDSKDNINTLFQNIFHSTLCNGKMFNSNLDKYATKGHYINAFINDNSKQNITNFKIDTDFCSKDTKPLDDTTLILKQVLQGFYDEEYFSRVWVPNYKKTLPFVYNDESSIIDVDLKAGQLHFILDYNPKESTNYDYLIATGAVLLYNIVNNDFKKIDDDSICNNIDLITYHLTHKGKDIVTKSIQKGCKILPSSEPDIELAQKQAYEQGYYGEEFLSKISVPNRKKTLPFVYNDEISEIDVKAGPGSQLHFILDFNPMNPFAVENLKLAGVIALYTIVNNDFEKINDNSICHKIDLITFHLTHKGKDIVTKSVQKGCKILPSSEPDIELQINQKKQGFYDEKYLSRVIIPREKADLPLDYNNEIRLVNIKPGTGSQLHYILNYKPQNPVTSKEAKELGSNFLYELFGILCGTPKFNELSQNVDLITYHFTLDGKDVLTKSINKGCKIN